MHDASCACVHMTVEIEQRHDHQTAAHRGRLRRDDGKFNACRGVAVACRADSTDLLAVGS
jgi:hypothetical protein